MAMVFSGEYDAYDQPIMVDDGTGDGSSTGGNTYYENNGTPSTGGPDTSAADAADADAAAGLIPETELKQLTGGKTYQEFMAGAMTPEAKTAIQGLIKSYGTGAWGAAKALFTKPDGTLNLPALGAVGGGILGAIGALNPNVKKVGYQGGIPALVANRNMQTAPVAGRRPGAGGTNYGGDVKYSTQAETIAPPVQTVQADATPATNPWAGKMHRGFATPVNAEPAAPRGGLMDIINRPQVQPLPSPDEQPIAAPDQPAGGLNGQPPSFQDFLDSSNQGIQTGNDIEGRGPSVQIPQGAYSAQTTPAQQQTDYQNFLAQYKQSMSKLGGLQQPGDLPTQTAAHGGLMGLAHGGRYLQGDTDGMADELRTSIDGKQPAALSHGEFVVPADVVSHLGNGNSDAGAKKLYSMMDKIRQARTGTKKQGKEINPDKFMPGGLAAAYAAGGSVKRFVTGGDITGVPSGTTGVEQTLAGWTGNYAPNMLAKTEALTNAPMPQYTGTLTAGASDLQNQAFAGASENAAAGYDPTKFQTGTFNTQAAQQYMNPYLQAALNPQLAEARRQSDITAQQNNAAMTKAGAFGGGRQAILTAENQRNLGTNLANITGQGYNTAYDKAMAQFNAEQNRGLDTQKASEASRQFGAEYGLKSLDQLSNLGATQRGITAEGIAADKAAFEAARNAPYEQLKFQSQMLNGLPIQATNYETAMPSTAQQVLSGAGGVAGLLGNKTSYTMDDVTAAMRKLGFNV